MGGLWHCTHGLAHQIMDSPMIGLVSQPRFLISLEPIHWSIASVDFLKAHPGWFLDAQNFRSNWLRIVASMAVTGMVVKKRKVAGAQFNPPDHCVEGPIYKFHGAEIGGVTSAFMANLVYCGEPRSGKVVAQDLVVGDESMFIQCVLLGAIGVSGELSMAWNDCMCVIDTNVWIKFGGVSGLKLHQVMAWKHRCSWQKVGALFSELWESDCCSGEELPDWRHQASSVFWCDGQGASFLALFVDWCSAACGATSLPAPSHGFRQQVQSFADGGGICQLVRLCLWPWRHWGDQCRSKQNSVSDSRWRRRLFWRLGHWCSC